MAKDALAGVGPRSRLEGSPASGISSDNPPATFKGREMISTEAGLSPSAVAFSKTLPASGVERMMTRLTPF